MMQKSAVLRDPTRLFAAPRIEVEQRGDGSMLLRSPHVLSAYPRCIGEHLERWARVAPDRDFVLERGQDGKWAGVTYAGARQRIYRIAAGLMVRGVSVERPLVVLSDNSVEHALLMLAAMHVGIPSIAVSPAYSLMSSDFAKLRRIISLTSPGLIFVGDANAYARALDAIKDLHSAPIVHGAASVARAGSISMEELESLQDDAAVERAYRGVGPDTIAKLLFTSGSTSEPKGVINTQRMLCSSQQARFQTWPFLQSTPPVIVDWLPWSHTFGGNHNFNMILANGGTLYIDAGRPTPQLFKHTIGNLRAIAPNIYFNVPRGYDMLVTALRADPALRENFFKNLQVIFYAAAALPQNLWDELTELALQTVGERLPLVSAWGSTETAPLASDCHFQAQCAGVIGIPVPGTELKLVRNGEKQEVRVRGPNVTPGYWKRPDLTASHFDEEGFYLTGDAVRFVVSASPEQGLAFDGRVSEDFKLDSGTWINVGTLRVKAIATLAPIAQDIVLTGHDRAEIGFLIFPNVAGCRSLCGDLPSDAPLDLVLKHPNVRSHVAEGLAMLRAQGKGSSTFATRALPLTEPPNIDAGEITDKGYINQRAVLTRRAALVEALYSATGHPDAITL